MKRIIIDIQKTCINSFYTPKKKDFKKWLKEILKFYQSTYEITIRIVGKKEMININEKYRNQKKPTNILSFSYDNNSQKKLKFLGDLIVCSQILSEEAKQQKKNIKSHWAHIIIHGTLHLLQYKHTTKTQQRKMESLESNIMLSLGYNNPYQF
ncbi:rRNA maturation RNase YbeY [Buchnera aphidicola (Formosaphis micheliae)]|uniref:rRNA maturation RNase YbeY n=1 Tax=Buchnera aphidicola TaxID=9 RepID=UPI0031B85D2D